MLVWLVGNATIEVACPIPVVEMMEVLMVPHERETKSVFWTQSVQSVDLCGASLLTDWPTHAV